MCWCPRNEAIAPDLALGFFNPPIKRFALPLTGHPSFAPEHAKPGFYPENCPLGPPHECPATMMLRLKESARTGWLQVRCLPGQEASSQGQMGR